MLLTTFLPYYIIKLHFNFWDSQVSHNFAKFSQKNCETKNLTNTKIKLYIIIWLNLHKKQML